MVVHPHQNCYDKNMTQQTAIIIIADYLQYKNPSSFEDLVYLNQQTTKLLFLLKNLIINYAITVIVFGMNESLRLIQLSTVLIDGA